MRVPLLAGGLTALICSQLLPTPVLCAAEPTQVIKVWPDGVQGPVNDTGPERILPLPPNAKVVTRVEGVTDPTLLYFPAPKEKASGAAVVICPGGGFGRIVPDLEGSEVAENLNAIGVSAFVLKYRTTPSGKPEPQLGPVMDAQRSISLIRSRASEFGLKTDRIGLLGISAGGQVSVIATSNHAARTYEARLSAVDSVSCRPDFLVLVYPWKLLDAADPTKLRGDIRVDKTMPPVFIGHAADDRGAKVEGSLLLLLQLQAQGVPIEAHIYTQGGHGFGLRPAEAPCPTDWPKRLAEWLAVRKLLIP
jgi:acetyl esterase/lipase